MPMEAATHEDRMKNEVVMVLPILHRLSVTAIKYLRYWTYVPKDSGRTSRTHKRGEERREKEWCRNLG